MKKLLKKLLPSEFLSFVRRITSERPILDVFRKPQLRKRVLVCYISQPLRKANHHHTNALELKAICDVFDDLGYVVDVYHYMQPPSSFAQYDVIFGFGDVFQKYFESSLQRSVTIHYATGLQNRYQNLATIKRVQDTYERRGKLLLTSARLVPSSWSPQTTLVDGIILLGNEFSKSTFAKEYSGPMFALPAPYFEFHDGFTIASSIASVQVKRFLWFGSQGAVHKGLDLCLEYFAGRTDCILEVCGDLSSEKQFLEEYSAELFDCPNIIYNGFVDLASADFIGIAARCEFVIFPSCSEGGSAGVVNAIANGGLIPIVSVATGLVTGHEIRISHLSVHGVEEAVQMAMGLSSDVIRNLRNQNLASVRSNNNVTVFKANMKEAISEILKSAHKDKGNK